MRCSGCHDGAKKTKKNVSFSLDHSFSDTELPGVLGKVDYYYGRIEFQVKKIKKSEIQYLKARGSLHVL